VRAIRPGVIVALSERCQGLLSKRRRAKWWGKALFRPRAVKAAGLAFIGAHEEP
jgi:hypothetical protein